MPGWGSCCWMRARGVQALIPSLCCLHPRWAKGGFLIEDAHESRYETNVDYSFFTEPVSCEVHNRVGSTNVSTLVNVHCEQHKGRGGWGGQGPSKGLGKGWVLQEAQGTGDGRREVAGQQKEEKIG